MSYSRSDLITFDLLYDPSDCKGTAYFEFHPAERLKDHECWLPGSVFLRDAAFDFYAECFHNASESFDYFDFVRFGPEEIERLITDLSSFLETLRHEPTREQLFAKYASLFSNDIWSEVATEDLVTPVLRTGEELQTFVDSKTTDTKCLWVLGM